MTTKFSIMSHVNSSHSVERLVSRPTVCPDRVLGTFTQWLPFRDRGEKNCCHRKCWETCSTDQTRNKNKMLGASEMISSTSGQSTHRLSWRKDRWAEHFDEKFKWPLLLAHLHDSVRTSACYMNDPYCFGH